MRATFSLWNLQILHLTRRLGSIWLPSLLESSSPRYLINPFFHSTARCNISGKRCVYHIMVPYADPEMKRRHNRKYQAANPGRVKAWRKRWYSKNKKHIRAYVEAHPFEFVAYNQRASAKSHGYTGKNFTASQWQKACTRWDNRCLCCSTKTDLTVDHVIPLSAGGPNTIDNVQLLCRKCNSRKGIMPIDFRPGSYLMPG